MKNYKLLEVDEDTRYELIEKEDGDFILRYRDDFFNKSSILTTFHTKELELMFGDIEALTHIRMMCALFIAKVDIETAKLEE